MIPLIRARHHAQVVEDLESCAPEVTAPYLQAAYDRMKLPIEVTCVGPENDLLVINMCDRRQWTRTPDSAAAAQAYFDLVSTFTDPAAHAPLARTAASLSAAANSPVTPGVSSSSTAAPAAVDAPVPPHGASAAEFTPLGSAAPTSGVR